MNKIKEYWRYYHLTNMHKLFVLWYMFIVCCKLMHRALMHDMSKYKLDEARGFFHLITVFRNTQYGTKEYNEILSKEQVVINRHYSRNDHHPEYHKELMMNMDFYQLSEMIVDWKAAIKKNKNGCIERSFKVNRERFNMSDELVRILKTI